MITKDKVVRINYTLKDNDGTVLDTSVGTEPLEYIHGNGYLIAGLEKELEGKDTGAKFSCTIQPADAYGERDERLMADVPMEQFESPDGVQVGMQFQVQTPVGPSIVTVVKVENGMVTIDANHQMAGKVLNFDIEVVEVRDPTEDELAMLSMQGCGGGCGGCGGGCGNCGEDGGCGCGDGSGEGCCGGNGDGGCGCGN